MSGIVYIPVRGWLIFGKQEDYKMPWYTVHLSAALTSSVDVASFSFCCPKIYFFRRYVVLWKYGGLYTDIDVSWIQLDLCQFNFKS